MRRILKWLARGVALLGVLGIAIAIWKRDDITRLLAVNSLFSEDKIVANFSNMRGAFHSTPLLRAIDDPTPLPAGPNVTLPAEVDKWIKDRSVTSLIVLKNGAIVADDYFLGTHADDLRINWSVSKSYLSALLGILIDEGAIADIHDKVTQYVPALADGAYADASIKDVLQMSSGVRFNEDYLDTSSDINKMGRVLGLGGSMDDFTLALTETDAAPGARWKYVSIDTHVIGMVIRGATGRTIADLLTEKLIGPLGFEADPYFVTDGYGVAFVLGGLNVTTRDNARFGQMIAQGGHYNGRQIVPEAWITQSIRPTAKTAAGNIGYGYQWWVPVGATAGQVLARGIYGQYIYIDQNRNVVIATHGADRQFRADGAQEQNIATFRAIAESLD